MFKRLREQPELCEQVEALLDEVENKTGGLETADQAEDAVVERVRGIGRVALSEWARQRCAQLNAEAPEGARRDSKKNSGG